MYCRTSTGTMKICSRQGKFELMSVTHFARSGGLTGIYLYDFLEYEGMLCIRGGSDEYTQYTIFNIYKNITINYPNSAALEFFQGTQERVRNSHGKRAISVRATEVLPYF